MAQRRFMVLADAHVEPTITQQLRSNGVIVDTVNNLLGQDAQDPDILQFAYQNGYTLLTHDKRIQTHTNARIDAGQEHAGVFIALEHLQGPQGIGTIVDELVFWHEAVAGGAATLQDDVYNQINWIR